MECDHADGTLVGQCAICGDPVCSECFQSVFNTVMCSNHEGLEDEGDWELIALYANARGVDGVRYFLDEQGLCSIAVETDERTVELYVPINDKDEVWVVLGGEETGDDMLHCEGCKVYFAREIAECPICGGPKE